MSILKRMPDMSSHLPHFDGMLPLNQSRTLRSMWIMSNRWWERKLARFESALYDKGPWNRRGELQTHLPHGKGEHCQGMAGSDWLGTDDAHAAPQGNLATRTACMASQR